MTCRRRHRATTNEGSVSNGKPRSRESGLVVSTASFRLLAARGAGAHTDHCRSNYARYSCCPLWSNNLSYLYTCRRRSPPRPFSCRTCHLCPCSRMPRPCPSSRKRPPCHPSRLRACRHACDRQAQISPSTTSCRNTRILFPHLLCRFLQVLAWCSCSAPMRRLPEQVLKR